MQENSHHNDLIYKSIPHVILVFIGAVTLHICFCYLFLLGPYLWIHLGTSEATPRVNLVMASTGCAPDHAKEYEAMGKVPGELGCPSTWICIPEDVVIQPWPRQQQDPTAQNCSWKLWNLNQFAWDGQAVSRRMMFIGGWWLWMFYSLITANEWCSMMVYPFVRRSKYIDSTQICKWPSGSKLMVISAQPILEGLII